MKKIKDFENLPYNAQLQSIFGMTPTNNTSYDTNNFQDLNISDSEENPFEVINSKIRLEQVIMGVDLKKQISMILDEFDNKELLAKFGLFPDNKFLFYGPSGCGKTLLAHALANKLGRKLFIVNLSTIIDSGLGKTSNKIFELFNTVSLNRGIIFFDEIDMLGKKRDDLNDHGEIKRVATGLLQALDYLDRETIFIGATNFPELVDGAILRRFNKKLEFKLPNKKDTERYIKVILKELGLTFNNKEVEDKIVSSYLKLSFAEIRDKFVAQIKRYIIKNKFVTMLNDDFLLLK